MLEAKQEGSLAGIHAGKPGLPRGRSRLPAPAVHASQRERLLQAAVAAVAQKGYPSVTVADIVRRAKVSRAAFYIHFRTKEECFLEATRRGGDLLFDHVTEAARSVSEDAADEDCLRAGCRAFLRFLAEEPAFTRVFYIEMPVAGPHSVERLHAAGDRYTEINAKWHLRARTRHPEWPEVPHGPEELSQLVAGPHASRLKASVTWGPEGPRPHVRRFLHVCPMGSQVRASL
jgi:AcrR family transcriptional regulator